MPRALTRTDIIERLHTHTRDNYLLIANVNKGLALAIAALAFLQVLQNIRSAWPELLPWLASVGAVVVAHVKWNRGVILTNARSNALDTVFALAVGISEFIMFAVFLRDVAVPYFWLNWTLCVAVHAFFAVCLVQNRMSLVNVSQDFEPALASLGREYVSWLRRDRVGAFGVCVGLVIAWALGKWVVSPAFGVSKCVLMQPVLAVACLGMLARIIRDTDRELKCTEAHVSEVGAQSSRYPAAAMQL